MAFEQRSDVQEDLKTKFRLVLVIKSFQKLPDFEYTILCFISSMGNQIIDFRTSQQDVPELLYCKTSCTLLSVATVVILYVCSTQSE